MPDVLAAPMLDATIALLQRRERSRRRDVALARTFAGTALALAIVAVWRIFDRATAREPMPVTFALGLVAFTAVVGLAFAVRGQIGRPAAAVARDLDRRLGLDDRATAALLVARGGASSRLATFVVRDAENALTAAAPRIDLLFPAKPTKRVTWLSRWLWRIALVVAAIAVLAELLAVGGPLHWLPGLTLGGGKSSALAPPTKDAPRGDRPGPKLADQPKKPEDEEKPESKKRDEPNAKPPQGDVRVALKPLKDEFEPDEPVTVTVTATATGDIVGSRVFDLRVSVDGAEVDTGMVMTLDPSRPEGDRWDIDLRKVPGLKADAGEHVARARLATRTTHEEHESAPAKFRVKEKPKQDDDQNKDKSGAPKPKPKPKPESPKPQPGDPSKKEDQPPTGGSPPLPPPAFEKKVVVPLFGKGDEVKKRGPVLVLDPGGGVETPPKERPLSEALPDAKRRAESAVDQAGMRDEDKALVRRYFELLEKLGK